MKTRLILFLIVMFSASQWLCAHDFEAVNSDGKTIYYKVLTDNTCAVTYKGTSYSSEDEYSGTIVVPSKVVSPVDGRERTVTNLGSYAFNYSSVERLILPEGLTAIDGMLSGTSKLKYIYIPSTLTTITGGYLTGDLTSLEEVEWNAKQYANTTDKPVFRNTTTYFNHIGVRKITFGPDVAVIPAYMCRNIGSLNTVVLSANVKVVGNYAFDGCTGLFEVYNLSSIPLEKGSWDYGSVAQYAKVIHTSTDEPSICIYTPDWYLTLIDGELGVFRYVGSATTVVMPQSFTINGKEYKEYGIMGDSFYGGPASEKVTSLTLPDNLLFLNGGALSASRIKSITIPKTLKKIGSGVFPSTIETVNWNATETHYINLEDMWSAPGAILPSNLKTLNMGEGIKVIPASFMRGNTSLYTFTIPETVEEIEAYAFEGCLALTGELKLPEGLKTLGRQAFYGCKNLYGELTFPAGLKVILEKTFYNCTSLSGTLTIPESIDSIGSEVFYNTGFTKVQFNAANYKTNTARYYGSPFKGMQKINTFAFGENVKNIPAYICQNLKLSQIALPEKVETIGAYAFDNCGASMGSTLVLPETLKSIGEKALLVDGVTLIIYKARKAQLSGGRRSEFYSGTFSANIHLANTVDSIPDALFKDSHNIDSVYYDIPDYTYDNRPLDKVSEKVTKIGIGPSVRNIPDKFFENLTKVAEVRLPSTVECLGCNAFNFNTVLKTEKAYGQTLVIDKEAIDSWNDVYLYVETNHYFSFTYEEDGTIYKSTGHIKPYGEYPGIKVTEPYSVTIPQQYCGGIKVQISNGTDCTGLTSVPEEFSTAICRPVVQSGTEIPMLIKNDGDDTSVPSPAERLITLDENGYKESFNNTMGDFTEFEQYDTGNATWTVGKKNIRASSYGGFCEMWLVSPQFDCGNIDFLTLQFEHKLENTDKITDITEYIRLKVTTDGEKWSDVPITVYPSWGNNANSSYILCKIDMKEYISANTRFAFVYASDPVNRPTWYIKNLFVNTMESYTPDSGFGYMSIPICEVANLSDLFYDIDSDGIMEYVYVNDEICSIYTCYGSLKDQFMIQDGLVLSAIEDIDRNGTADFIFYMYDNNYKKQQVYIMPYDTKEMYPLSDAVYGSYNVLFDANGDGRTDYYVDIDNNGDVADYIYIQQSDGSFVRTDIIVETDEEEILKEAFAQSGANIVLPPPVHFGGASLANAPRPPHRGGDMQRASQNATPMYSKNAPLAVDINRDGKPDLLNLYNENSLVSMSNGHYYYGTLFGQVTVGDYNSDGIQDFIIFEPTTKTVYLYLYDGNNIFSRQILMQNMNISQVESVDIDNDGDLDIVLAFDWTKESQYAMLVTFRNDNGTFKKTEYAFGQNRKISFFKVADVDGDGIYEIVCGEGGCYDTDNHPAAKYFLAELTPEFTIVEETPFHYSSDFNAGDEYPWSDNVPDFIMGDFDNDGNTEYWVSNKRYDKTKKWNSFTTWNGINPYCGRFKRTTPNTPPDKMEAPTYILDAASGMLKIEWQPGTDAETAACDLTYSVRIGSESGKSDILEAQATATGSRLRIGKGNANTDLFSIFDIRNWSRGTYHIAVQAIDKDGLAGKWSEELTFTHEQLYAVFEMDYSRMFTTDTLTLKLSNGYDPQLDYEWSLGNNAAIVETDDNGTWRVVFSKLEEIDVELRVSDKEGVYAISSPHHIVVLPVSWKRDTDTSNNNATYTTSGTYFDVNMDGQLDVLGTVTSGDTRTTGLHTNNGGNRHTKVPYSFNLDLDPGKTILTDFNMDGFADFYSTSAKGNVFTNTGNGNDFIYEQKEIAFSGRYNYGTSYLKSIDYALDIDMDGYVDMVYKNGYGLWLNSGDNATFYQFTHSGIDKNNGGIIGLTDFNSDGLVDIMISNYDIDTYLYHICWLQNNGDGTFANPKKIISVKNISNCIFHDLDNDGNIDIIGLNSAATIHWNNADGSFTETELDYPISSVMDIDNNGYVDMISTDAIIYQQGGRNFIYTEKETDGNYLMDRISDYEPFADMNGDSRPDSQGKLMSSVITNTVPEAPANVKAVQEGGFIVLSWDEAYDRETPYAAMRYNVSVKKAGATGDGSYIISPLNNGSNTAAAAPSLKYLTTNKMKIPASRFSVGESYEVKVQAIDGWNANSPFSEQFVITIDREVSINAPTEACTGVAVTVTYAGTEQGTPQWSSDGAEINANGAATADFIWSTPGVKTIECTVNGVTSTRAITIMTGPDLEFSLPSKVLSSAYVYFTLPAAFADSRNSISVRTSIDDTPKPVTMVRDVMGGWIGIPEVNANRQNIIIERRGQTLEARMIANIPDGDYCWIEFVSNTESCGETTYRQDFSVSGDNITPEISIVSIDGATGKNVINWQRPSNLPNDDLYTTMVIYREEGATNNFVQLGEAGIGDGQFTDMASDPSMRKYRYRIALKTNYGGISTPSEVHSSVHVMLNRGLTPGSVNIVWTPYEGGIIEQYTILRGTSPDNMQTLTTASGYEQSYTDMASPSGDVYYALSYTNTYDNSWGAISRVPNAYARNHAPASSRNTGKSNAVNANTSNSVIPAKSLTIRHMEKTLSISETQPALHLYTEILPGAATYKVVNWQVTSGQDLITVTSSGLVSYTGNGTNGTATVKATTVDGSNISQTINIPVQGFSSEKAVTEVTLHTNLSMLTPNQLTTSISATVIPSDASDRALTWSVASGSDIVSVNQSGLVTALEKNGVAVIRATASNGVYGEITVTASGFNGEEIVFATAISVYATTSQSSTSPVDPILTPSQRTLYVKADITPYNVTQKEFSLELLDGYESISGVTNMGTYYIVTVADKPKDDVIHFSASTTDGTNLQQPFEIRISGFNTGTDDAVQDRLTVYPVPADDILFIDTEYDVANIRIIAADGKVVYTSTEKVTAINVRNLPSGIYLLQLTTDSGELLNRNIIVN